LIGVGAKKEAAPYKESSLKFFRKPPLRRDGYKYCLYSS
jgi:hypothetical protein